MPTLSEFRRWLQGERVAGLPAWKRGVDEKAEEEAPEEKGSMPQRAKLNVGKAAAASVAGRGRYTIDGLGKDALLHFGKYNGWTLSRIRDEEGSRGEGYLRWMLAQEFPEELKTLIKEVLAR